MTDNVNNPSHYQDGWSNGAEVIDITENLNFNRGNAVKYIARAGKKDPEKLLEDLQKAEFYLKREIARVEAESQIVDLDEPRVWDRLQDLPDGVTTTDRDGDFWKRVGDDVRLWFHDEIESVGDETDPLDWDGDNESCGPFTEVKF